MPASKRVDPAERAKVLYIRVSEPLHQRALLAADGVGMSVGEWARWIIAKEVDRDRG